MFAILVCEDNKINWKLGIEHEDTKTQSFFIAMVAKKYAKVAIFLCVLCGWKKIALSQRAQRLAQRTQSKTGQKSAIGSLNSKLSMIK